MCLFTKQKKPRTVKHGITCYKILNKVLNYDCHEYTTPFMCTMIPKIPCTMEANEDDDIVLNKYDKSIYEVYGGYIHAYRDIKKINLSDKNRVIVKCRIPL